MERRGSRVFVSGEDENIASGQNFFLISIVDCSVDHRPPSFIPTPNPMSSSTPRAAGLVHGGTFPASENGGGGAPAETPRANDNDAIDDGKTIDPDDLDLDDPTSFLSSLALDPATSKLLDPSFDPAAAAGAELAAAPDESRPRAVAESLRKVAKKAERLSAALVSAKREQLAAPLSALASADAALREAAAPAAALRAGLARARQGVAEPVEELQERAKALEGAHAARRLLRAARRRASSAAALRAAIAAAESGGSHPSSSSLLDLPALARAVADARAALEEWPPPRSDSESFSSLGAAGTDAPTLPLLLPSLEEACGDGGPQGVARAAEGARRLARAALSAALGGGSGGGNGAESEPKGGEALAAAGDALLALHWLKDARAAVEDEVASGAVAAAEPLRRIVAEAEAAAARPGGGGAALRIRSAAAVASLLDASSLWDAASSSFSALARGASRARLLDEAASRRTDPETHERLAAGIFGGRGPSSSPETALARYWRLAPLAVAEALEAAVVASSSPSGNSGSAG